MFVLYSTWTRKSPHLNTFTYRSSSIHGSIDEDRVMPLPRTKKTILNSASSSSSINTNSSNTSAKSSPKPLAATSLLSSPPSCSPPVSLSSTFAAVNRNDTVGPPPMPPPRRAASQLRLVGWLVVWFGWIFCSTIVHCGLALCVHSGSFDPFVPNVRDAHTNMLVCRFVWWW